MKKNIKFLIIITILIFIFLILFMIGRRESLNIYIRNTNKYANKINYSTNIILDIKDSMQNSKIDYNIIKSNNIKHITISKYDDKKLSSNIDKYLINENNKVKCYIKKGKEYESGCETKEEFSINYDKLYKGILKIKKIENIVIDEISYKRYTVYMNKYDAYNFIYNRDILNKKDLNGKIIVEIVIDKSNEFISSIKYKIDNLNNSDNNINKMNYEVEITNYDINNNNKIELPFKK